MNAFIVRPFGEKNGVNFDEVQTQLVLPALKKAGINGYTTGVILEAGNIRQDMFQLLLTSDLVIADISIHNANVFYELGIRHALRAKKTLLIRCRKDEVPFDLKTDRYLAYDNDDLPDTVDLLSESIKATMRSNRPDSPVFMMLPKLKSQNAEDFLAIPADFSKEVFVAQKTEDQGKLALLAIEATFFPWELPALRVIAEIQYRLKFYEDARQSWEIIEKRKPNDIEANDRLATIYHRLGESEAKPNIAEQLWARSDQAIESLFKQSATLDRNKRAEVFALKARNEKVKWIAQWDDVEPASRGAKALRSNLLMESYKNYSLGFQEDLNHFYSGVNALGMLKLIISLAENEPNIWEAKFGDEADGILDTYKKEFNDLAMVVGWAVDSERKSLERDNRSDPWVNMTIADLELLTSDKPERVAHLYFTAIESGSGLNFESAMRQLLLYQKLKVMEANVKAALNEFSGISLSERVETKKAIVFSGHMIDKEDRKEPRFPKEREDEVREKIRANVKEIIGAKADNFVGVAGGACGGDILFHEVCKELGIKSGMYLALPPDKFIVESVKFAGNSWVDRFYAIHDDKNTLVQQLSDVKELPIWLQSKADYSFWERNNLWILNSALTYGGRNLTFLALWNGKEGDGSGGTKHMIEEAEKRGAKSIILSP